ncbi:MAG TPA: protein kinase [Polyangiaceae bacterium]|jgi:serine/threonine-protein kinase|nr:protein kinase [Polyangiaceae bacterium]
MNVEADAATSVYDPLVLRARGRVGSTLRGKWRLDALLGIGGMAAVYAATHRNGSRAAVKLLHTEWSVNPQTRSRFLREGYVANAVGHDGAVKVIDDDVAEDGSLFLVTELLDGETLDDRRVRLGGRLQEDEVLSVVDQLLDVLAAAHGRGVVHRDLKPENVFLTRTGVIKVLDFGIARLRELSTASTATQGGATMGTPAFMSPEQARGLWDEVDAQSDLWAVGATMFNLLTGRLVHEGRTSNEQLLSAMTNPAPSLASAVKDASPAVAHVVDRALAIEKSKRWADASRMQEAVRRAYHDRNSKPITTAPRLTIPETVPNRTLGSVEGAVRARPPTTGRPVVMTLFQWARSRPRRTALAVSGATGVGVVAIGIAAIALAGRRSPASVSTSPPVLPAVPTTAVARTPIDTAPPAPEPPAIAATDLPTAPTARPTSKPATTPRPLAPSTPAASATVTAPAAKPSCNPPYVLEPSGKKKWKAECL